MAKRKRADGLEFPDDMRDQLLESKQDHLPFSLEWDLAQRFYEGNQWLVYDRITNNHIVEPTTSDGETRLVINRVLTKVRAVVSLLRVQYPSVAVLPASPSTEDTAKGRTTEEAARYFWHAEELEDKFADAILWMVITGTVALHTYYDGTTKDAKCAVVNAYDLFFEPGTRFPDESDWVGVRHFGTRDDLIKTWGEYRKEIEALPAATYEDLYGSQVANEVSTGAGLTLQRVVWYDVYWKDGRHAQILEDGTPVYQGKCPAKHPVSTCRFTVIPRRVWGMGLVKYLMDPQMGYNRLSSAIVDNARLMSNPSWLLPMGSLLNPNAVVSRPGKKLWYNPTRGKPEQAKGAELPRYVGEQRDKFQAEMMDLSAQHSTSLGARAIGVESGTAMQELKSADRSQLADVMGRMETMAKRVARSALQLMQAYYPEEKWVRMMDSEGVAVSRMLRKTELIEDPEVFIEAGSLFRDEAQDRDQKILDLFEKQLIGPEAAMQALSMRTGLRGSIIQKVEAIQHAHDLLDAAKEGLQIEIYKTDDRDAFAQVFGEYLRSHEYYRHPQPIQDYIRDIFVWVTVRDPEQAAMMSVAPLLFPPSLPAGADPADKLTQMMTPKSQATQGQVVGEQRQQDVQGLRMIQANDQIEVAQEALGGGGG